MAILVGATGKDYISSISMLDEREIWQQVLNVTNEDATLLDLLQLTDKMSMVTQPTYSAFFNNYLFRSGVMSAVDATTDGQSAGENIQFTLTADAELPLVGDIAMFTNKQTATVISVNTSTRVVVAQPESSSYIINPSGTAVAAAQKVIFFSNTHSEGGTDPSGRRPDLSRTENSIQIFKNANKITDLQKAATIEVMYGGEKKILFKMQHDTLMMHRAAISNAFLVGSKAKYTPSGASYDAYKTQGLRKYILGGDGSVYTTGGVSVSASGSPSQANFKTMSRTLDKRGAPSEYHLWVGGDFGANLDDLLTTLTPFVQGGIQYNDWGSGDAKQRSIDLGVSSFKIYDRTFHKKTIKVFDHPELFGATGFDFSNEAYLVPAGQIGVDASGEKQNYISGKYMEVNGKQTYEFVGGKLAPRPTDDEAALKWSYESICGLQVVGTRLFGIFS